MQTSNQSKLMGLQAEPLNHLQIVSLRMVKESQIAYSPAKVSCAADVYQLFKDIIGDADREACWIACFDTKNQITCLSMISMGTLSSSLVHPREVFKLAILSNSRSIILVHNHPSGDPTPSPDDHALTHRIKEAGKIVGIDLLDHLVIGATEYYSFKEDGELSR